MKLDFIFLDIEGFRSYLSGSSLNFYKLTPGLHFVRGENLRNRRLESNGAGKSSIWAALTWALYGKTVGGLTRNDIRPWSGKSPTYVEVGLRVDKKKYFILRSAKELRLNNEIVPQEKIDALIGMSFEVFTHTILLGQGRPLFYDLAPSAKLDLFSAVLNLDRWDEYSKRASEEAKTEDAECAAIGIETEALSREKDRVGRDIQALGENASGWEAERKARDLAANADLGKLQASLKISQTREGEARLKLDSAGTELKQIEEHDLPKLTKTIRDLERQLDKFAVGLRAKKDRAIELEDELEGLGNGDRCPTCGQSVKGTKLAKHKADLSARIDKLHDEANALPPKRLSDDLAKARRALGDTEKYAKRYRDEVDKYQTARDFHSPRVAELQAQISAIKASRLERADAVNPYLEQKRVLQKRDREIDKKLDRLKKDLAQAESNKTRALFWVKGFKEVKLFQVEECLHELEIATNAMLDDAGLVDWEVRYDIEKETKSKTVKRALNVMILSPDNTQEVKWESWSGGEGQRLRICGSLALAEVLLHYAGIEPSLEILDEPTASIAKLGIQDVCEFLADRADRLDRQIFLTDQHALESTSFASVLTVVKDKNGSRIETE